MRWGGRVVVMVVVVMVVAVTVRCRRFHSISDQIGPENRRRDWKISHGNYGRLLQLYTSKMSGTPLEIYTYAAYISAHTAHESASRHCFHLRFSTRSFHLFTHNQRAPDTDSSKKWTNFHDTFVPCPSIIIAMRYSSRLYYNHFRADNVTRSPSENKKSSDEFLV